MTHRRKQLAMVWMLAACASLYCQSSMSGRLNFDQRSGGARRITLEQVQQQAAAAADPMAHLAQLQVEGPSRTGLAPVGLLSEDQLDIPDFHFNKFMGQEITIQRPLCGWNGNSRVAARR